MLIVSVSLRQGLLIYIRLVVKTNDIRLPHMLSCSLLLTSPGFLHDLEVSVKTKPGLRIPLNPHLKGRARLFQKRTLAEPAWEVGLGARTQETSFDP